MKKKEFFKKIEKDVTKILAKLPGVGMIRDRLIFVFAQAGDGEKFFCQGIELDSLSDIVGFVVAFVGQYQNQKEIKISLSELGQEERMILR